MKKILVIDSGSGGVNILREIYEQCKSGQMLYFADQKRAPYGEKSPEKLKEIACSIIDSLSFFNADIIVFACNTLTSTTIEHVRKRYPDKIFVGCEPALKPACKEFDESDVLLLATSATIKNARLLKTYPAVQTLAIPNLPMLIDEHLFDLDTLIPILREEITPYSPKAIVLGCTHFEGIKKQLAFTKAKLFSSAHGVAKRVASLCDEEGEKSVSFMTSGDGENLYKFSEYFFSLGRLP